MPENKKHKYSHFKDERLSDPRYKNRVKRYPGDSKKAICVLCNKLLLLSLYLMLTTKYN